jgi:plasmid stabilization system protein ParE
MQLAISPVVSEKIERYVEYLLSIHEQAAAKHVSMSIQNTINKLFVLPGMGHSVPGYDHLEIMVLKTKLVLWYRLNADELEISDIWHSSQARGAWY